MITRITLLYLGIILILPVSLDAQIPTNGLVCFYPFNGNALDESGNGHNAIVYGATLTTDRFGRPNSAYYFDGIDDYLEIIKFASIPVENQARTVALWIYTLKDTWMTDTHTIFEYGNEQPFQTYGIDMSDYPVIQFYSWDYDIYCNTNAPEEGWILLAFVDDGKTMKAYINGKLLCSRDVVLQTTLTNIFIGCEEQTQYYLGKIDDICIYNRALSADDVTSLYTLNFASAVAGDTNVCQGQENVSYEVSNMDSIINYHWSYNGTGATIIGNRDSISINFANNATSGNLVVVGDEAGVNGADTAMISITVNPLPLEADTIIGDNTVCSGQIVVNYRVPVIDHASEYIWSYSGIGATMACNYENITIDFASNATSGNLTVFGNNACGSGTISPQLPILVKDCDSVPSYPLNVPNSFTPNGDGINDVFYIRNLYANSRLIVFDRSGKVIYESNSYQNDWGGIDDKGKQVDSGTYWYVLTLPGFPLAIKGFVYIKK